MANASVAVTAAGHARCTLSNVALRFTVCVVTSKPSSMAAGMSAMLRPMTLPGRSMLQQVLTDW